MRIVVFTADRELEQRPWWRLLVDTPGIEAILVCRKIWSRHPREVLRRFTNNVRKQGLLFVPMRLWALAAQLVRSLGRHPRSSAEWRIPVETIEVLNINGTTTVEAVRRWGADLGISLGAPILKQPLFATPTRGTINLHLGMLPDYRGAPPAFWELWNRATEIGASVHRIDAGLDTGTILGEAKAPIYPMDSLARVEARAAELGELVLGSVLKRLIRGEAAARIQPPGGATYRFPTILQQVRLSVRLLSRRAAFALTPRRLVKGLALFIALGILRPVRDLGRTLRRRHPVRVFTFHRVSDLCRDGMTVSPSVFRRQLEYLKQHHDLAPIDQCIEALSRDTRLRRPLAAITFDDAYRSVYRYAAPIVDQIGVPACCFVTTDLIATERRFSHDEGNPVREHLDVMDWVELADLQRRGWRIGGHTATHPRLSECDGVTLQRELAEPMRSLREHLAVDSIAMAYPFGGPDDLGPGTAALVRDNGYSACFSDYGGENRPPADRFDLRRFELGGDHDTLGWKAQAHGIDLAFWRNRWDRLSRSTA